MGKSVEGKIKKPINNLLSGMGEEFTLLKLVVKDKKRGSLVRALIDKPGGITIDDCARISRELSVQLDVLDLFPGPYNLEISSPGLSKEVK
ncbi:MAG: hypothetical protein U9N06_02905 [candidate division WOR-3 bacterium]|nr:hypothetical protein [candidate division WOR-3 bacterium]